mgnify:CR=1 FL=1
MSEVCFRVKSIHFRRSVRVYRREIGFPFLVPHVHYAFACEQHGVPSVSGRHYTIEHIHSASYAFQKVSRCAHAHQIAGLFLRNYQVKQFQHLVHLLGRFTHGQSSYRDTGIGELECVLGRLRPKVRIDTALDYGEECLGIAVERLRLVEVLRIPLEPILSEFQGIARIFVSRVTRTALVECHHNVGTYDALGIHHVLWCKDVLRAIYMRTKLATFFTKFAYTSKREYLETAGVG